MNIKTNLHRLLLLTMVAIALTGCVSNPDNQSNTSGGGTSRLPSNTVEDIVSYADQMSVFTVLSEREIPPPAEVLERGEGYIGREITIRIDETPWSRESIKQASGEIDLIVQGWTLHDNKRKTIQFGDAPRLSVGSQYVGPLVWITGGRFGDGAWVDFTSSANIRLENNRTIAPDLTENNNPKPIEITLGGKTVSELEVILNNTPPDPFSVQHAHLDPEARYRATKRSERQALNQ